MIETTTPTPSFDNLNANLSDHDKEAVSLCAKSVNQVERSLSQCFHQNKQLDTFAVDHLLSKFNSDTCKVYVCMSPVDRVGLPYFENYGKPNDGKQLLCILLCDGVHFQGYIVDINRYKVIHIDLLSSNNSNNGTSQKIAQNLLESETNIQYESLFPTRRQFDSNSCGVWLVAGIASSVLNLPIPSQKQEAFEIAYSLVEYVKSEVTPLLVLDTEEFKKYSSAEFLINVLLNEPQKSEYFREKIVKGLRNNYFYGVDITQNSLQDINADDSGAYKQIRNTSTMFHYKGDKVHTVYRNGEELYYNRKVSYNRYEKVHISVEEVVTLH